MANLEVKNYQFPKNLKDFRIHFVGIKGTGMAALVEICVSRGAIVTGTDVPDHFYTDEILKKIKYYSLHRIQKRKYYKSNSISSLFFCL